MAKYFDTLSGRYTTPATKIWLFIYKLFNSLMKRNGFRYCKVLSDTKVGLFPFSHTFCDRK